MMAAVSDNKEVSFSILLKHPGEKPEFNLQELGNNFDQTEYPLKILRRVYGLNLALWYTTHMDKVFSEAPVQSGVVDGYKITIELKENGKLFQVIILPNDQNSH